MQQVLSSFVNRKSEMEERFAEVEAIKLQMRQYVLMHGHCLEAFLFQAYEHTSTGAPPQYLQGALNVLGGLSNLINLYCSRGDNFESTKFRDLMEEFDIAKKDSRLMHLRLDQWRVEADEFAREEQQQKKKKAKTGKNAEEISELTTASTSVDDTTHPSPLVQDTREDAGLLGILAGALEYL
jgi:UDP-2,3-diacylglucosamine pyrophosphatase LpxH